MNNIPEFLPPIIILMISILFLCGFVGAIRLIWEPLSFFIYSFLEKFKMNRISKYFLPIYDDTAKIKRFHNVVSKDLDDLYIHFQNLKEENALSIKSLLVDMQIDEILNFIVLTKGLHLNYQIPSHSSMYKNYIENDNYHGYKKDLLPHISQGDIAKFSLFVEKSISEKKRYIEYHELPYIYLII